MIEADIFGDGNEFKFSDLEDLDRSNDF